MANTSTCNVYGAIHTAGYVKDGSVQGWVYQPNIRGTLDLLWSCLLTVFLCTWVMLCLNVPAANETRFQILLRRLRWMIIAVFGPEFVLTIASGQWASVTRSVSAFHEAGYTEWTARHAYFADMGGIHLSSPDVEPFPINAKQLLYLVSHKYVEYPEFQVKDISDKSKANGLAKTITILQSSWLILQCLGRWIQGLALTTLELSALAIVICTLATYICWLRKPADVEVPMVISTHYKIAEILCEAGDDAKQPYWQTPLDFIDNQGPSWSANVMTRAKIPSGDPGRPKGSGPVERPLPRITNDRLPDLAGFRKALLFFVTLVYAGIHLVGWNFSFPTQVERILWRSSSMILFVSTFLYWFVETIAVYTRTHIWKRAFFAVIYGRMKLIAYEVEIANRPQRQRKAEELPLWWEFLLLFLLWCVYVSARFYLIVEVFIGLRKVPVSVYHDVNWSNFIPHM